MSREKCYQSFLCQNVSEVERLVPAFPFSPSMESVPFEDAKSKALSAIELLGYTDEIPSLSACEEALYSLAMGLQTEKLEIRERMLQRLPLVNTYNLIFSEWAEVRKIAAMIITQLACFNRHT